MQQKKYLIFGLGNYASEYRFTRHNIGSDYIEFFSDNLICKEKKHYILFQENKDNKEILYIIPKSYMNTSGIIFLDDELCSLYKNKKIEKTLVLHDDLDIPFEKIKLRVNPERSHRGHNGCRSILEEMKKENLIKDFLPFFLSIGIGRPNKDNSNESVSSWVLKQYNIAEKKTIIEIIFPQVRDAILSWIDNRI